MFQVLDILLPLASFLMMVCAIINASIIRLSREEGASYQEALKRVTTIRSFWIEIICSVFSLVGFTLVGLQDYSFLISVLRSLAVVLVLTIVLALLGFWLVGLWLTEKKAK